MNKPTPKPGQEWEKRHNDGPSSPPTRIRIVEWKVDERSGLVAKRGIVESDLGTHWGRRRSLLLSALSNTPSGYRLVKEAP